jgi:hypothetical protein
MVIFAHRTGWTLDQCLAIGQVIALSICSVNYLPLLGLSRSISLSPSLMACSGYSKASSQSSSRRLS